VDREDYASLLYVITSFPHIRTIRTKKTYKVQHIQLHFSDDSVFPVRLAVALNRVGRKLMDAREVLTASVTTGDGIRVPSAPHRFDYFFQRAMLDKTDMPESFCREVREMPEAERSVVFGYLVTRYRFVIHTLNDLFAYQRKYRLRVNRTLKAEKPNRKIIRYFRSTVVFYYWLSNLFGAWKEIHLQAPSEDQPRPLGNHIKAFLMKKAAG
jgi:hypothetical protein